MKNRSLSQLRVSVVETEKQFRDLSEVWSRLARSARASLFLQYEWLDAAWAWRKQDSSLFVLVAWGQEGPVGILPLVKICERWRFPVIRSLEFLAVPDTQCCDMIAAPEHQTRVAEAFCGALHERRREWDRLLLRYLDETSAALNEIKAGLAAQNYACDVKTQGRNLYITLAASWNSYYSTRSRSLKKANNLAANRLKKVGRITIEWITPENFGEPAIHDALEKAIDVSRRSWKQATGNSLNHPGPRAFIDTLTAHATRRGWLSLWLMSIDGKPIAMEYQLLDAGNVYALRADFDAECEEISPGSHLMRTLVESLFGRSLQRYYMGLGENAYKTRWTEHGDALHQLVVHGRTWRGRLIRFMDVLKHLARSFSYALPYRKTRQISKDSGQAID